MRLSTDIIRTPSSTCLVALFASLFLPTVRADENSIAALLSAEWRSLHAEVTTIDLALSRLPTIPSADYGGTRSYIHVLPPVEARPDGLVDFTIRLTWEKPQPVDLVALVPSRKIDSSGLDPNYGFPEDFTLSLINSDGSIREIASFSSMSDLTAHRGHPIVKTVFGSPEAMGLEIHVTCDRPAKPSINRLPVISLSEIFCFSGNRNIAADATVNIKGEKDNRLPPFWNPQLLVDGITPLGLPERPAIGDDIKAIGWISHSHDNVNEPVSVTLNLGKAETFDTIRMFPAMRPTIGDFPGFGIPRHFRLLASDSPTPDSSAKVIFEKDSVRSSDHSPIEFHFDPASARYVHLEALELWKPFEHYPAFIGFSELQILNDTNVISGGAFISVSEADGEIAAHHRQIWLPSSLTDGSGPTGSLMNSRDWIKELDKRLALETRREEAAKRMADLERKWQRGSFATVSFFSIAAISLLAWFPSRYRSRERRRVREIRERIAADLHDDVGSNLGSIQMLATMARDRPENRDALETIDRVAAETVNSVRDIVWLLQPKESDRVPTIDHLRESAAILLDPLDWTLSSDFKDWQLGDEDGRHLVLFCREVLNNIRRHSRASEVLIEVEESEGEFVLTVSDNGKGIESEKLDQPTSLRALYQRADRLGGRIEVETNADEGTTISLRFTPRAPGSSLQPVPYPDPL